MFLSPVPRARSIILMFDWIGQGNAIRFNGGAFDMKIPMQNEIRWMRRWFGFPNEQIVTLLADSAGEIFVYSLNARSWTKIECECLSSKSVLRSARRERAENRNVPFYISAAFFYQTKIYYNFSVRTASGCIRLLRKCITAERSAT